MIVMLRLSVWNIPESVHSSGTLALAAAGTSVISTVNFAPRPGRRAYIDDEQLDLMQSASNGSPVDTKTKISNRTSNEKVNMAYTICVRETSLTENSVSSNCGNMTIGIPMQRQTEVWNFWILYIRCRMSNILSTNCEFDTLFYIIQSPG